MISSTERHLKDIRIVAIETFPVERNAKFIPWAGMTPCIPACWEGTGQGTESQEVTVDFRLNELGVHSHHKAAVLHGWQMWKSSFPWCLTLMRLHGAHCPVWNLGIAEGWEETGKCPAEVYHCDQKWTEAWSTWLARMCWGTLRQVKGNLIKHPAAARRVITNTADPRFPQQHHMIQHWTGATGAGHWEGNSYKGSAALEQTGHRGRRISNLGSFQDTAIQS